MEKLMEKLWTFTLTLAAVFMATMLVTSQAYADRLFATSGAGRSASTLFELDPTTGAIISTIGATGFTEVVSLAFDPITGVLYGISNASNALITIDTATGAGTLVARLTGPMAGKHAPDMGFASDGTLYTWSEAFPDRLNAIDVSTGVSTEIGPNPLGTFQFGLDVDSTDTVYIKNGDGMIYTVDKTTGATTFVVDIDPGYQFDNALAFDSNDNLFTIDRVGFPGSSAVGDLYAIDLTTGATTFIGSTGVTSLAGIAFFEENQFDPFTIRKAEIRFDDNPPKEKFKIEGAFTLSSNSNGIDPLAEDVRVTVGTSSVTIPAGSFVADFPKFEFKGTIAGVDVKMKIEETDIDTFKFKVDAKGVDLTGTANPTDVSLDIGDDSGSFTGLFMEGKLKFKAKRADDDDEDSGSD